METTSICEIPYARLEELSAEIPSLQRQLLRVMSKEILQDEHMMMLLGRKAADERLAALMMASLCLRAVRSCRTSDALSPPRCVRLARSWGVTR